MDNSIGDKIRKFRKRAGISQFELELQIDASPGSISRIENGQVNPTKETLKKISDVLNLTPSEFGFIQGINMISADEILVAISTFTRSLDLQVIIKNTVDILLELYPNYNGGAILLLDDNNSNILRARAVTEMPGMDIVQKILGAHVDKFPFDLTNKDNGLVVDTLITGEKRVSKSLSEFARGAMPDYLSSMVAKTLGFAIGITLPIIVDKVTIGVMLYTKKIDETFSEEEQKILQLLSNQIGIAVMNGKQFEKVKQNSKYE